MLGDAFFHVIPHLLGMHSHGGHDYEKFNMTLEHHDEHEGHEEQELLIKIGTIVVTMYGMWFISTLMKLSGKSHDHCNAYTKGSPDTCHLVKSEKEIKQSKIAGVLFGDCMCNGTDGLAMGVAWTAGFSTGLGEYRKIVHFYNFDQVQCQQL